MSVPSFLVRIFELFHKPDAPAPKPVEKTEPGPMRSALDRAEALQSAQAERDEYLFVCTESSHRAFQLGYERGYPSTKVRIVRSYIDVAGFKGVTCVMADGWSHVVRKTQGALLQHMRANGWKLVTEDGTEVRPSWYG